MSHLLIKYQADYADEFYIYGFLVERKEVWNKMVEDLYKYDEGVEGSNIANNLEYYFGTNEAVRLDYLSQILNDCSFTEITKDEAELITRLFGKSYGTFIPNDVFETVYELLPEKYQEDLDNIIDSLD